MRLTNQTRHVADHTMQHVAYAQLVMLLSLILDEHGAKTINIGDLLGPIIGLLEDQNANVRPRALAPPPHGHRAPRTHSAPAWPQRPRLPHVLCNVLCGAHGELLHRSPRMCRCARQQCKHWSASTGTSASR